MHEFFRMKTKIKIYVLNSAAYDHRAPHILRYNVQRTHVRNKLNEIYNKYDYFVLKRRKVQLIHLSFVRL